MFFSLLAPWKAQMAKKNAENICVVLKAVPLSLHDISNFTAPVSVHVPYASLFFSKHMQICLLLIVFQWCVKHVDSIFMCWHHSMWPIADWVRTAVRRGAIISVDIRYKMWTIWRSISIQGTLADFSFSWFSLQQVYSFSLNNSHVLSCALCAVLPQPDLCVIYRE